MNRPYLDIKQLAATCESRLSSGDVASEKEFVKQYPEIQQELLAELKKRRMVDVAIKRVDFHVVAD